MQAPPPSYFQAVYIIGVDIIYEVTTMLEFMAGVMLTSKLCPKEMESTVYALLSGFQNFGSVRTLAAAVMGQQVSRSIGLYLIESFGVKASRDGPCDFSKLTYLLLVCHFAIPLIGIPLSFLLLPNKRLSQDLLGKDSDHAHAQNASPAPDDDSTPLLKKKADAVGDGRLGSASV